MVRFIRRHGLFVLSLLAATLININFSILRSLKAALIVTAKGGGAEIVPHLHLWAVLPAALGLTWLLTRLLRRHSLAVVFPLVTGGFLAFFLVFAFFLYPQRELLLRLTSSVPLASVAHRFGLSGLGFMIEEWSFTLFYVAAELWKVGILTVLFFALLNQVYQLSSAKRLYGPLMLGGSFGALLAGPLISYCCREGVSWEDSLKIQALLVTGFGLLIICLFALLERNYGRQEEPVSSEPATVLSFRESFRCFLKSRYLICLAVIVLADYVVYSLGELVFLDRLHAAYPEPADYCAYFGRLTFWAGLLTAVGALVVAPYLLSRHSWVVTAIATPLILLLTVGSFFGLVWLGYRGPTFEVVHSAAFLHLTVFVGGVQFCFCRASKYTLFDSSKELAYVPLPRDMKLKGKLVIDGVGARFGRAFAAIIAMSLVSGSGSILAAAPIGGVIALGCLVIWIRAARAAGKEFEALSVTTQPAQG